MFQTVWKKWSRLDIFVANAGGIDGDSKYNFSRRDAAVDDLPPEPNTSCTDVDFKGVIYGTTLATHFMRRNPQVKGGKIIVTGSMVGVYPCATFPEYCAAKAAVHQWVRTVGPVLQKKDNITVNCVMPGGIETPAMPGFSEAFLPQQMTLQSTLMSGYDLFLEDEDNSKTGQLIEAAHRDLIPWEQSEYKSGAFAKRTHAVYEPWFSMLHGERSELLGALQGPPSRGPKIIAVTGATGSQGGGVLNVMKGVPGWKVRALTRNPTSDAAKRLADCGIEVVKADFDDESSLRQAFDVSAENSRSMTLPNLLALGCPSRLRGHELVGTLVPGQEPRRGGRDRGRARHEASSSCCSNSFAGTLHLVYDTKCKAEVEGEGSDTAHGLQSQCRRPHQGRATASRCDHDLFVLRVLSPEHGVLSPY
jgi:NAD(P)-dependent dehydrogenase (short-subunit alcohol dehydrogenase family)